MSVVTNVILTCRLEDEDHAREFTSSVKLETWDAANVFAKVDEVPRRGKAIEMCIFVAAFNYLDEDEFKKMLSAWNWEYPEGLAVFVCRQEDDRFTPLLLD